MLDWVQGRDLSRDLQVMSLTAQNCSTLQHFDVEYDFSKRGKSFLKNVKSRLFGANVWFFGLA